MIDRYTNHCHAAWSDEGGEYVGLCAAFPSLSWLAATRRRTQPSPASGAWLPTPAPICGTTARRRQNR